MNKHECTCGKKGQETCPVHNKKHKETYWNEKKGCCECDEENQDE